MLSWALSLTLELPFCLEALKAALQRGRPEIFNSDQGSQFTSEKFTGKLERRGVVVSMDGRRRCLDNIFIERLWRSLMSLIHTCELNGVNSFQYLVALQRNAGAVAAAPGDWMPWNFRGPGRSRSLAGNSPSTRQCSATGEIWRASEQGPAGVAEEDRSRRCCVCRP